jgi:hypothetical protein
VHKRAMSANRLGLHLETQNLKLEPQIPEISQILRRLLGMTVGIFSWQNFRVTLIDPFRFLG